MGQAKRDAAPSANHIVTAGEVWSLLSSHTRTRKHPSKQNGTLMWCLTFWKSQVLGKCDVLHISCSEGPPPQFMVQHSEGWQYSQQRGSKVPKLNDPHNSKETLQRPLLASLWLQCKFGKQQFCTLWATAVRELRGAEGGHVNLLTQRRTGGTPFSELHILKCQAIHC